MGNLRATGMFSVVAFTRPKVTILRLSTMKAIDRKHVTVETHVRRLHFVIGLEIMLKTIRVESQAVRLAVMAVWIRVVLYRQVVARQLNSRRA